MDLQTESIASRISHLHLNQVGVNKPIAASRKTGINRPPPKLSPDPPPRPSSVTPTRPPRPDQAAMAQVWLALLANDEQGNVVRGSVEEIDNKSHNGYPNSSPVSDGSNVPPDPGFSEVWRPNPVQPSVGWQQSLRDKPVIPSRPPYYPVGVPGSSANSFNSVWETDAGNNNQRSKPPPPPRPPTSSYINKPPNVDNSSWTTPASNNNSQFLSSPRPPYYSINPHSESSQFFDSPWENPAANANNTQTKPTPRRPPPPPPKKEFARAVGSGNDAQSTNNNNSQNIPENSHDRKERKPFSFIAFGDSVMRKLDETIGYSNKPDNRMVSGQSATKIEASNNNSSTRSTVDYSNKSSYEASVREERRSQKPRSGRDRSPQALRSISQRNKEHQKSERCHNSSWQSTESSTIYPDTRQTVDYSSRSNSSDQIPSTRATPQPGLCLKCRDFSVPDQHAALFPRESYNSVQTLAINLCASFPDIIDKARAMFTWMHHNIAYDAENFLAGTVKRSTPESTLRTGMAVCQGYAELFAAMASHVGLKAVVVSGHGKGYGYTPGCLSPNEQPTGHAWNAVKFPHGWHLIDCCWGAGFIENRKHVKLFKPCHFVDSPEEFRRKHFPTKSSDQHCRDTMSWNEYINMDDGPTIYTSFSGPNADFSPYTLEPAERVLAPNTRYQFRLTRSCEHKEETQLVVLLCLDGKQMIPLKSDGRGGLMCTGYTGNGGTTVSLVYLQTFNNKPSGSFTVDYYESRAGRASYTTSSLCQWNVG